MTPEDKVVLAVTTLKAIEAETNSALSVVLIPRIALAKIQTLTLNALVQLGATTDAGTTQE